MSILLGVMSVSPFVMARGYSSSSSCHAIKSVFPFMSPAGADVSPALSSPGYEDDLTAALNIFSSSKGTAKELNCVSLSSDAFRNKSRLRNIMLLRGWLTFVLILALSMSEPLL